MRTKTLPVDWERPGFRGVFVLIERDAYDRAHVIGKLEGDRTAVGRLPVDALPSIRSIVPLTRWLPGGCCCWARAAETVSAVARTATVKIRVLIMLLPP
jgi:hypothetical protein